MKRISTLFSLLILGVLIIGCNSDKDANKLLPTMESYQGSSSTIDLSYIYTEGLLTEQIITAGGSQLGRRVFTYNDDNKIDTYTLYLQFQSGEEAFTEYAYEYSNGQVDRILVSYWDVLFEETEDPEPAASAAIREQFSHLASPSSPELEKQWEKINDLRSNMRTTGVTPVMYLNFNYDNENMMTGYSLNWADDQNSAILNTLVTLDPNGNIDYISIQDLDDIPVFEFLNSYDTEQSHQWAALEELGPIDILSTEALYINLSVLDIPTFLLIYVPTSYQNALTAKTTVSNIPQLFANQSIIYSNGYNDSGFPNLIEVAPKASPTNIILTQSITYE
ncbi:hypothetical protein [Algivirga pacifica]|uniref:Lipoprotein n=1 Tax=Algivirga pacifica TaxID=1162670 RepID=A0ABP9DFU0_9BACT